MEKPEYEKPERYIIPVAMALFGLKFRKDLAAMIGVDPSYLHQLLTDDQRKFSDERLDQICKLFRSDVNPPINISSSELILPKDELIKLIPKDHPRYMAARAAAGLPMEEVDTFSRRQLLFGNYVRLFIATRNIKFSEIVLENFTIEQNLKTKETRIIQHDYEWEDRKPYGIVRVLGEDTIEIQIDYDHPRDPKGTFLAEFPKGAAVKHILAMALDVKYHGRQVVTRPVLFIKVPRLFKKKDRFSSETNLFKRVKTLFENCVPFDSDRFEIVPSKVREEDLQEVILALDELRVEGEQQG